MVQWVQCGHAMLCSENSSCKRIKTNIFTSGIDATFWGSEQMTRIQKVEIYSGANMRASGCRRQAVG